MKTSSLKNIINVKSSSRVKQQDIGEKNQQLC